MKKRLNQLDPPLNKQLAVFLSISLAVFLFVLFFQPFPFDIIDSQYPILLSLGFGIVVFLVMLLVRVIYPCLMKKSNQGENESVLDSIVNGFVIWFISSVSFSFFLNYIGFISLSFYLIFKVTLICLAPPLILGLYDKMRKLMTENEFLRSEKTRIQKRIDKLEAENLNSSIDFITDNKGSNLSLLVSQIVFIKSADNYVEIHFMEGDQLRKKLLRNTLRNIELQIKRYENFIRCHRMCIVNTHYIEILSGNSNNYKLILKGSNKQLPVSRQYILKVKEAI